ncbi:MAG: hypothetical protein GX434_12610 [Peptococcaceae bacterium]|nr:hypothetical protein [Peptococcaceae bacterium]
MNDVNYLFKLKQLADEGENLLHSGLEIAANTSGEISPPVLDWLLKCNRFLGNMYGNNSAVLLEFKQAYTIRMSVNFLVSLAAGKLDRAFSRDHSEVHPENKDCPLPAISLLIPKHEKKVLLSLKQTVEPYKRTEALELFNCIRDEITSYHPDWDQVCSYLKKGFDFGIPFGTELAVFANACFNVESNSSF